MTTTIADAIMSNHAPSGGPEETTSQEVTLRRDLAAAYRLAAHFGWDDLLSTHISAQLPDTDHYLLNPLGLLFEEITASSLVKVDREGNIVGDSPYGVNRAGFVIHGAVHEARRDATCVIHLHTQDGVAVTALEDGLLPLNQQSMSISQDIAFHEFQGVAFDLEERDSLVEDLGDKNYMLLHNHGTLVLGTSVGVAFSRAYTLEWACTTQVRTLAMGRSLHHPSADAIGKVVSQMGPTMLDTIHDGYTWPALLRRLDRVNPGYDA